jgi:hypothetical protein
VKHYFPPFADLGRVNGIQMEVPSFKAHFKISVWEFQDIQPKFELPQVWVHVDGVPDTKRPRMIRVRMLV